MPGDTLGRLHGTRWTAPLIYERYAARAPAHSGIADAVVRAVRVEFLALSARADGGEFLRADGDHRRRARQPAGQTRRPRTTAPTTTCRVTRRCANSGGVPAAARADRGAAGGRPRRVAAPAGPVSADRARGGRCLPTVSVVIRTCDRPLSWRAPSRRWRPDGAGHGDHRRRRRHRRRRAGATGGRRARRPQRPRARSERRPQLRAASARGALLAFLDDDDEWLPVSRGGGGACRGERSRRRLHRYPVRATRTVWNAKEGGAGRTRRAGVSHAQPRSPSARTSSSAAPPTRRWAASTSCC